MSANLPPTITVNRNLASTLKNYIKQNGGKQVSESEINSILQKVAKFDAERDAGTRAGGSIFSGGHKYLGGTGKDFVVKQGQQIQLSAEEFNEIFKGFIDPIGTQPAAAAPVETTTTQPTTTTPPETTAPQPQTTTASEVTTTAEPEVAADSAEEQTQQTVQQTEQNTVDKQAAENEIRSLLGLADDAQIPEGITLHHAGDTPFLKKDGEVIDRAQGRALAGLTPAGSTTVQADETVQTQSTPQENTAAQANETVQAQSTPQENTTAQVKEAAQEQSAPIENNTTGNVVAVKNDDGTSHQIDGDNKTITKYDANNEVVEQRAMTPEETTVSTQELIDQLNAPKQSADKTTTVTRNLSSESVSGSYSITSTEDGGYKLEKRINIVPYRNKAALTYMNRYGTGPKITQDKQGIYHFRNLTSDNFNVMQMLIQIQSKDIASETEIYKDLLTRQSNGETLTSGETQFMSAYLSTLSASGLRINSNGELEDIQVKKRGKHK